MNAEFFQAVILWVSWHLKQNKVPTEIDNDQAAWADAVAMAAVVKQNPDSIIKVLKDAKADAIELDVQLYDAKMKLQTQRVKPHISLEVLGQTKRDENSGNGGVWKPLEQPTSVFNNMKHETYDALPW